MQEKIEAVQRMQDYINEHLLDDITLAELSKVSLFSPWYSHRIFTELLGVGVGEYIRKLRLSKSALKLRDQHTKIADIAFEMGFKSVDGYQRAFHREFDCNPHDYSKKPIPVYLFIPYGIKFRCQERKIKMNKERSNVFIQVINKPSRKVIIKRGREADEYMAYCGEVGCDVWGLLKSMSSITGEPVCLWLPAKYKKPQTSEYVQGVEVPLDYNGVIPEGFDVIELPESAYLMFQGEQFKEEDFEEAILDVKAAIDKYNPKFIGYSFDNDNPRIQLEPIGERGYIELLPIKQL